MPCIIEYVPEESEEKAAHGNPQGNRGVKEITVGTVNSVNRCSHSWKLCRNRRWACSHNNSSISQPGSKELEVMLAFFKEINQFVKWRTSIEQDGRLSKNFKKNNKRKT